MNQVELDAAVDALVRSLDVRWGVDTAWLFGSRVRLARAGSDIDLAVLFRTAPSAVDIIEVRADLAQIAGLPVDVVDLERASPIIAYQAIKTGRLVADRAPRRRIDFVAHLPGRYEDLMILRRPIERAALRRIAHDRT